jgi:Type II secretory pathway, ATPase PulE/Tfp pilus assembly pathway, ATPase PilB
MNEATKKRLGDMLVEEGKITTDQLSEALKKQREQGKRLGEILVNQGIVSENEIIGVLEQQLKIKRVKLDMINVDKKAVMSIPANLASKHTLIPVAFLEDKILVAMWDPLNIFAIDDVKIAAGYDVQVLIATREEINRAIERYYSDQYVQKAAEELSKEKKQEAKLNQQHEIEFEDIKNAPAVKMVDHIIKSGVEVKASDIHIEPFEEYVRIRYRVDGELQQALKIPKDTHAALVTRIKILANLNIAEKRTPQDGRIITKAGGKEIDLRISILPTVFGEKIVIRILNRDSYTIGREKLGMTQNENEQLDRIIKNPHGIVLVTGPTGSGKSTTLYTILNDLNKVECNIVTVEDPVEYMLPGINQVNVNAKAGLTFASGLRSILRQDPDIVMIGEIRDSETAEIAVRAAITGHLVLSTIHTNDAPSSIVRLMDMGIQPYLVATSVCGVISQRLVRKVCPYCKVEYQANESEKKIMGFKKEEKLILHKGKGCGYCKNTGYSGRTGVYEIMELTRKHRELIASKANSDVIKDLSVEGGMTTLNMACKELVLKGITTIDELVKVAFLNE